MQTEKRTGVVILNYNNSKDTINCLSSIYSNIDLSTTQIIVVDNGSTDDSVKQITEYWYKSNKQFIEPTFNTAIINTDKELLIKTNKNLGYAAGNNLGIKFLLNNNFKYILILNNDIIIEEDIIPVLIKVLENNPTIAFTSPILLKNSIDIDYNCCRYSPSNIQILLSTLKFLRLPFAKKIIDSQFVLKKHPERLKEELISTEIISGSCMMAKSETWDKLGGGFDENTFLYYEENILYEKVKKLNMFNALTTKINAIHLGARTTLTKLVSNELFRIGSKSLLYYLNTYRTNAIVLRFLVATINFTHYNLRKLKID